MGYSYSIPTVCTKMIMREGHLIKLANIVNLQHGLPALYLEPPCFI